MLNDLVLQYYRIKTPGLLNSIVTESNSILYGLLKKYFYLPWQIREEMADCCCSKVLTKTLKNFNPSRSQFQTLLYWNYQSEIDRVLRYYNRHRRINLNNLVSVEELIDQKNYKDGYNDKFYDKPKSNIELNDSVEQLKKFLSPKAFKVLKYLLMGYSKRETFRKANINKVSEKHKIIIELRQNVRQFLCI